MTMYGDDDGNADRKPDNRRPTDHNKTVGAAHSMLIVRPKIEKCYFKGSLCVADAVNIRRESGPLNNCPAACY